MMHVFNALPVLPCGAEASQMHHEVVRAREGLLDALVRWRQGDRTALASLDSWMPPSRSSVYGDESRSFAVDEWQDPALELCRELRSASGAVARSFAAALAQLSNAGWLTVKPQGQQQVPAAFGAELLQREVVATCCSVLERYMSFAAAWRRLQNQTTKGALGSTASYASPFDSALTAAHCCAVLADTQPEEAGTEPLPVWPTPEPQLVMRLLSAVQESSRPMAEGGERNHGEEAAFRFVESAIQRRAATLCGRLARIRSSSLEIGKPNMEASTSLDAGSTMPDPPAQSPRVPGIALGERLPSSMFSGEGWHVDTDSAHVLLLEGEHMLVRAEGAGAYHVCQQAWVMRARSEMSSMSPYEVLGLTTSATDDDVTSAYRRLAKQHHPDKGGDSKIFLKVRAAFDRLMGSGLTAPTSAKGKDDANVTNDSGSVQMENPTVQLFHGDAQESPVSAYTPIRSARRRVRCKSAPVDCLSASFMDTLPSPSPLGKRQGAKRARGFGAASGEKAGVRGGTSAIPPHEQTVNGLLLHIYAFLR